MSLEEFSSPYLEDLQHLIDLIGQAHPKPDFCTPQEWLDAELAYALSRIPKCQTNHEFFQIAQRYLNAMGDIQTRFMVEGVMNEMRQAAVMTEFVDGKVVVDDIVDMGEPVTTDGTPLQLSKGDEILFIDGNEVERRMQELLSLTAYSATSWGRLQSARGVLFYPAPGSEGGREEVAVLALKPDGILLQANLRLFPVTHPAFESRRKAAYTKRYTHPVEGKFIDDGRIGVLTFRSFSDKHIALMFTDNWYGGLTAEDLPYMDDILFDFFQEAEKNGTKSIVLDLRTTDGGSSYCMEMPLKYLTDKPLLTYSGWIKVSEPLHAAGMYREKELGIHNMGDPNNTKTFPYYTTLDEDRLKKVKPFHGNIIALMDNKSWGGEWLLSHLWAGEVGLLLGESGGSGGGHPGEMIGYKLPNTGLHVAISCKFFVPPGLDRWPVKALIPHRHVRQTLQDYREGRDTIMEAALEMCR